jgi:hypothetical protein
MKLPNQKKQKRCYHCAHSGSIFKLPLTGPHCHCEHPREMGRGEDGWGTLRFAFDTCPEFEPKVSRKRAVQ